jgi:hypothetical protein
MVVPDRAPIIKFAPQSVAAPFKHTNRMNDSYVLARFCIPDQGNRVDVDYYLPFEGGVIAYQLISALRILARVAPAAIHEECSQTYEDAPGSITPERVLN